MGPLRVVEEFIGGGRARHEACCDEKVRHSAAHVTTKTVEEHLADPGYTPSIKHAKRLLELLAGEEDAAAKAARALLKLGDAVVPRVVEAFAPATPPLRGRLVDLWSDFAQQGVRVEELRALLLATLGDADAKSRRNAVIALAHHEAPEVERALLDYWRNEERSDHRRSVARSLARVGGEASLALLRVAPVDDPELARACREAVLTLERRAVREHDSSIDAGAAPERDRALVAHCRKGVEELCRAEFEASWKARVLGPGRVEVSLRRPLGEVFRARTMTWMGFELAPRPIGKRDIAELLAAVITSEEALAVLRRFTRGAVRYRIEWAGAGHRRGATARVVDLVARAQPTLINDPRESTWEVVALERNEQLLVELVPKRLDDPRFTYRVGDVPAASHPTLAAALVRVAGAQANDVVWDPFVGSGMELCERGLAGPYAKLLGRDHDARAVTAAQANLSAAKLARFEVTRGDAFEDAPTGVTLIVTNPPLGHRVGFGENVSEMLERFVDHAARSLAPRGRMVWVSPIPVRTERAAVAAGLRVTYRQRVALPGFDTEIQRYDKP
jgi:predicted RNA methylase